MYLNRKITKIKKNISNIGTYSSKRLSLKYANINNLHDYSIPKLKIKIVVETLPRCFMLVVLNYK